MNILEADKSFIKAGFTIWKILASNRSLQLKFAYYMVKLSHNPNIKLSHWIKTYLLYSKSLYYNSRYKDSIQVLKNILQLFYSIPIDEVRCFTDINREDKIRMTNVYMNFDVALDYYSRYTVYKSCESIFLDNTSCDNRFIESDEGSPIKLDIKKNTEHTTSDNSQGNNNVTSRITFDIHSDYKKTELNISVEQKLADLNICNCKKLEEYLDSNLNKIEIPKLNSSNTL
jgi:hypothetical protein